MPVTAGPPGLIVDTPAGCALQVRVVTRAGRSAVVGVRAGALLVRLAAVPVGGAANEALLTVLAGRLHCPRRALSLTAGTRSRTKRVAVSGLAAAEAYRRLAVGSAS